VLDPGHAYWLTNLDAGRNDLEIQLLRFVKRDDPPEKFPGNKGHYAGTTMQEVLRALIDRLFYVGNQIHDPLNEMVLRCYREALRLLELRAAARHNRHFVLPSDFPIEEFSVCPKCGHMDPELHKECHAQR
jgi:hypothetical protein